LRFITAAVYYLSLGLCSLSITGCVAFGPSTALGIHIEKMWGWDLSVIWPGLPLLCRWGFSLICDLWRCCALDDCLATDDIQTVAASFMCSSSSD